MTMAERPFLILTQRRTGGTSLVSFLSSVSGFPTVQHEPFNLGRKWGEVAVAYDGSGNEAALRADVASCVALRRNIKHCVEVHAAQLNRALIDAAAEAGYSFFLLTRRDDLGRNTSRQLAELTGAWGPEDAAKLYPAILDGTRNLPPLNLKFVQDCAVHDTLSLARVQIMLRNRRIAYDWLVFEELYMGAEPVAPQALRIARSLGIDLTKDDPRLAAFADAEGQRSARIEAFVPNMADAIETLRKVCIS